MTTKFRPSLPTKILGNLWSQANEDWLQRWIQEGVTIDGIKSAESFARRLDKMDLSKTAMRNFYNEVKDMQLKGFNPSRFLVLRSKLVYALGKNLASEDNAGRGVSQFLVLVLVAHEMVDKADTAQFGRFMNLLETLLAYHKLTTVEGKSDQWNNNSQNKHHHGKHNNPNRR